MNIKNDEPLISVIVPVYNVESYLERCVRSILEQVYANIEIILINDGSTDMSGKKCDLFAAMDSRIKVIHKINGGLSSARNSGMQAAKGEYITFVDSDDWISKDYISYMYEMLMKYDVDISVAEFQIVSNETEKFVIRDVKEEILANQDGVKRLLYQNISNCSYAKLYKRSIFENISFPQGKLYEDVVTLYLCFSVAKSIALSNKKIYAYYMRDGSIVRNNFSLKKMDYYFNSCELMKHVSVEYPDLKPAALSRLVWAEVHLIVQMYECRNEYADINNMLWKDIRHYRIGILRDRNVRKINKFVLILSFGGQKLLHFCYTMKK